MNLKHIKRSDHCLNCKTELQPGFNYCPVCGQLNNIKKETAFGLLKELTGDFLHLDSKVMSSLIPLLFRPGTLTNEYVAGRRARYLHPVRLFISITIIMLIVTSLTDDDTVSIKSITAPKNDTAATNSQFTINFSDSTVAYSDLKAMLDSGLSDPDKLLDNFKIEKTAYNRFLMKKAVKLGNMSWNEIGLYIKSKLPWILFALMPVFAFIMYLLHSKRKWWFADHLIYSFHLHSASFIVISINSFLSWLLPSIGSILLFYIPVYYFISLKRVYGKSWTNTFLKGILAGLLYITCGLLIIGVSIALLFLLL